MDLVKGKVAIVTGGGRGIGRGVVLALAKEGAKVAIAEYDPDTGISTANEVKELGAEAISVQCDVTKRDQVNKAVEETIKAFGTVDILVNVAQACTQKSLEEHTDADFDLALKSGLYGTFYFMQAVFPYMKEKNYGKIINFASDAGLVGMINQAAYASTKEAVRALTKNAANEWGVYGIRCNVLCPLSMTPGVAQWKEHFPDQYNEVTNKVPLRYWGDSEKDIGPLVVFLASNMSDYMTKQTIAIDGGSAVVR
ncbi:SDR family NAD(P)-dependent oxidoreductase [Phosphitispora sp. TUW77]|uniref:SDR family NAD(P)-dependent oxidoreductase n=1 Tax=Phosphitispora sp. TUW77 TaxID=3152361 RepID=UPI003AB2F13F